MSRYAGRYELIGLLGVGGMGSVYRVKDRFLDEEVALKILRKDLAGSKLSVARFYREVKLARKIQHHNVVRIFDAGEFEGEHYFTMECVIGDTASALFERGPMEVGAAIDVAMQIASALSAAHAAGVVHRDLKPDNVLVSREGRAVLTDFGVAFARDEPGDTPLPMQGAGTPKYMSPEQIEGRALDERTDLYALGLMLFEMLTGTMPWGRDDESQRRLARLAVPAATLRSVSPHTPESLSSLVARMLEREPEDRVPSADELLRQLVACRNDLQGRELQPPPSSGSGFPSRPDLPLIATTSSPHVRGLAVLPMRNLGREADDYLAEAMTGAVTDRLALCPGVRIASVASLQLQPGEDPLRVGRRAGVDVVVESTLQRRANGALRVRVRMLEMERGFVLWSSRFEGPTSELFDLQSQIAKQLAQALTVEMAGGHDGRPADRENVDVFLRARHAYAEWMPRSCEDALDLLSQAVQRSPGDPMLLVQQSLAQLRLWHIDPHASSSLASSAQSLARNVLEQSPHVGEAHLALGIHALLHANWIVAARRLEEAVRCSPGLADAHAWLGQMHCWTGLTEQGLRMIDVALRLDPHNLVAFWAASYAMGLHGEPGKAYELLDRADAFVARHPATVAARLRIAIWNGDRSMLASTHGAVSPAMLPSDHLHTSMARLVLDPEPDQEIGALTAYAASPDAPPYCRGRVMQAVAERAALGGMTEDAWSAIRAAAPNSIDAVWFLRCPALVRLARTPAFLSLRSHVAARAAQVFAPPGASSRSSGSPFSPSA